MVLIAAGRKPYPAIAHDRRRDTVNGRRGKIVAPSDLAIIMGVHIDKAGRDHFAFCVDFFAATRGNLTDMADVPVIDGDIGFTPRRAGPVNDETISNN